MESRLNLGFTPDQIAGNMNFESYDGVIGYQTIYRLIKKTNGEAFSHAKVSVIGSGMALRLEAASFLTERIFISDQTAWI
ncbi:MAG: hypothetical protein QS748_02230 [Candidatus Endonucleobacter bathymodioli]|uniref:Uncharacterized protein n=1 Tax=Candidatus Endonucleibacter bathymodioli TaxID=539814 RepID=A0AA90NZD2_9GAMM|nr:hypothetical protein [Candidatus Endonucleobacter bathymodioli]